jgi:hypothetical protein
MSKKKAQEEGGTPEVEKKGFRDNTEKKLTTYGYRDLESRYEQFTSAVRAECVFGTECVGGQPADEEGIRQFVIHHLKIEDPAEADKAVKRIMHEELEDVTPVEGEIQEKKVYGVRAVRRTTLGPYLGPWMIKACLKVAASRLGIFMELKGTKGNLAEAGRVRAWKYSLQDPENPELIYVRNSADEMPCHTYHKEFMGRVQTPTGPVSIIHQSECIAPGSRFAWEFRFIKGKLKEIDLKDCLALMMVVGLGSARSLERGKFRIENLEIEL